MKRLAAALACLLIAALNVAATYSGGGVGTPSAGTAVAAAMRGGVAAYPTDVEEESAPQGSFYESGVDDE